MSPLGKTPGAVVRSISLIRLAVNVAGIPGDCSLVTLACSADRPCSDALAAMADWLGEVGVTEPVQIIGLAVGGTGFRPYPNDLNGTRNRLVSEKGMTLAVGPRAQRRGEAMALLWLSGFVGDRKAVVDTDDLALFTGVTGAAPINGALVDHDMTSEDQGGCDVARGGHAATTTTDSAYRMACRAVEAGLRASGHLLRSVPFVTDSRLSPDGTQISFRVVRARGQPLQTAWAKKGVAVPAGEAMVQVFEIWDDALGRFSRSWFTAEIVGDNVVLTNLVGRWRGRVARRFNACEPLSYGIVTKPLKLIHGTLYEAGPDEGGVGLPVHEFWLEAA